MVFIRASKVQARLPYLGKCTKFLRMAFFANLAINGTVSSFGLLFYVTEFYVLNDILIKTTVRDHLIVRMVMLSGQNYLGYYDFSR